MRTPAALLYLCTTEDPPLRPARVGCCAQPVAAVGLPVTTGAIQ
ncbi:hypothetical protein ACFY4B_36415 [Kitasatospora sp. NPDC001261]